MRVYVYEGAGERLRTLAGEALVVEAKAALADPANVVWADIQGRSPTADTVLTEVFGFHELAIEDVYKERHRPKVEDYDAYLYVILRGLRPAWTLEDVTTTELDLFLGSNFVVTHHKDPLPSIEDVNARLGQGQAALVERGAGFLAHAIIDRLVDRFMPIGDAYEDAIDRLEDDVLAGEDRLERIVGIMTGLQHIRRLSSSQRDVVGRLARGTFDEVPDEAEPFFRDVHDHLCQLVDHLESQRDELNAVFQAYHSLSAHRMNEIMKVLTLISTIMLPLTFVTGLYGMNFENMPELHWAYGYYGVWGLMILLTVTMYTYFRHRRWL